MRHSKWLGGTALLIAVALLLAVNMFSTEALKSARLDLTENNVYTLSSGTRNLLARLDEPVTLRLFLSQDLASQLPTIATYTRRVRDLVDEYRRAAGGNLRVEVIDPEPFSEAEDQAVAYGLAGVPINEGGSTFYFGLVASGPTGKQETISFLSPDRQSFLEYDMTKLIHQVAWPEKRVIGLLSALEMDGNNGDDTPRFDQPPPQPWIVLEQMRQLFEVDTLDRSITTIPEAIDVLMLVQPSKLSETTLYAVDQFVLRGGRVLAFVDPKTSDDQGGTSANGGAIDALLAAWGLRLDRSEIVADLQLAEKVRFNTGQRVAIAPYPVWITVPEQLMDPNDVVTANLGSLLFATAGHLASSDTDDLTITPLVQTTASAGTVEPYRVGGFSDPEELLRSFTPGTESRYLVVRVNGQVQTAFPDGPPKTNTDEEQETATAQASDTPTPQRTESGEPVNLIVVADTDLLRDRFWVQVQNILGTRIAVPSHANGSFVVNALDNLTGDNDLISVRNRGQFERPFTKLDELAQRAELQFREKEQQLLNDLRATEQRLAELERGKGQDQSGDMILSAEQSRELTRFRQRQVEIRKELRQVRHQLNKDIETLQAGLVFVNAALVPLLIALGSLVFAWQRRRNRKET